MRVKWKLEDLWQGGGTEAHCSEVAPKKEGQKCGNE